MSQYQPTGGIRWQIGRTLDDIRVAVGAGNVERVADLTRFLVMVASPELTEPERKQLSMPKVAIGRDVTGERRAEALEGCFRTVENVLRLLKGRGIYASQPIPDGGSLADSSSGESGEEDPAVKSR